MQCSHDLKKEFLASEAAAAAAHEQEAIASASAAAAAAAAAAAEAAVAAAAAEVYATGPLPAFDAAQFQALHTAAAAAEETEAAGAADADAGASRAVPVVYAGPLPAFDAAQFQALHFAACNLTGRDPGDGCVVAIGRTRALDLFGLWAEVRARGGHAGVTGQRQWADVSRALGASGPDNAWPGASVRLRQAYESAGLLALEQLLAAGVLLAPPPPPQPPSVSLAGLPGAHGLLQQFGEQAGEQAVAELLQQAPPPQAASAAAASGGGAPTAAVIAARLARAQGPRLAPAAAAAAALEPGLLANLVGMPLAPEGPAQQQQQQQAEVEVICGAVHGVLDVARLRVACMCDSCLAAAGPYGHEMTLAQFQKHGGCAKFKNWKRSVQVRECGTKLGAWLKQQNVEVPFSNTSGGLVKGRQAVAAAPQHAMQQLAAASAAAAAPAVCGDAGTHADAAAAQVPSNNLAGLAMVIGGAQSLQQQQQLAPLSEASHHANSGPALVGLPIAVCWDGCEFGATVEAFEEASGLHLVAWHGGDRELEALDLRQECWRLLAAGQPAGQQQWGPPAAPPDDSSLQHATTGAAAVAPGLTPALEHHAAAADADDEGRPLRVVWDLEIQQLRVLLVVADAAAIHPHPPSPGALVQQAPLQPEQPHQQAPASAVAAALPAGLHVMPPVPPPLPPPAQPAPPPQPLPPPQRVIGASGQAEVAVRIACGSCIGTLLLQPADVAAGTGTVICHCDGCVAEHASTGQLRAWDLRVFERHGGMGRSRNARNSIKVLLPPDGSRRMTLGTWLGHFQQLAAAQAAREVVMQQQLAAALLEQQWQGALGPESLTLAAAPALPAVSWPAGPVVAADTTTGPQQMDVDAQPVEHPPAGLVDAGAAAGGGGGAREQHPGSSEVLPPSLLVSGVLQELASRKRARHT